MRKSVWFVALLLVAAVMPLATNALPVCTSTAPCPVPDIDFWTSMAAVGGVSGVMVVIRSLRRKK
ncbi:MAG TPA: hypothetical protein VLV89_12170 [Candidatus Acidoferrum sp.]|nr:hypothetical protein [Candidatus Acidoferrum sp.]